LHYGDDVPEAYRRHNRKLIVDALGDTRVVFVMGARQVGKSTLTGAIAGDEHPAAVVTLDNSAARSAATDDPEGFLSGLSRPVLLDEVQRAGPDLLLGIKEMVDVDPSPGQFLVTGSANVLTNRKVNDALTGRIELVTLWPLSQSELEGAKGNIVDALFSAKPPRVHDAPKGRAAFVDRVVAGGYPEAVRRIGRRRERWLESYLKTTLDRDLRDVSDAQKLDQVPRLLRLLASRAANLLNSSEVGRRLGLDHKTVRAYTALLETIFLVRTVPAWRPSIGSRESTTPKVYVVDSGLLAYLLGANEKRLAEDDQLTGSVLENFVMMEVTRHLEWAQTAASLYHYRSQHDEVDVVLEDRAGGLACIEVKATATIRGRDWRALAKLRDSSKGAFKAGFLIYSGEQTVPLGDRLWAVPVSGLWA
jgi:predicted AAA+ superfamily ATPase